MLRGSTEKVAERLLVERTASRTKRTAKKADIVKQFVKQFVKQSVIQFAAIAITPLSKQKLIYD